MYDNLVFSERERVVNMAIQIPESHRDLLVGELVVTLITTMPDGHPQGTVVWCRLHEGSVQISITDDSQKYMNVQHDPRVSVVAVDTTDPYRYLEVRGMVSLSRENSSDIIREIAREYGRPDFDTSRAEDKRVILTITPTKVIPHG